MTAMVLIAVNAKLTRLMYLCLVTLLLNPQLPPIHGSNHWVVNEGGMVRTLPDSPMHMRHPWDLVEWLRQESRYRLVRLVDKQLEQTNGQIERTGAKDINFEADFYLANKVCRMAGRPLAEFNLYSPTVITLETKGIISKRHLPQISADESNWKKLVFKEPVCEDVLKLHFSPFSFEHLEAMQKRKSLVTVPEIFLYNVIIPQEYTPDQYGHLIYLAMQKNSTSWVLFNLAAFYWRVKGSAPRAIECLRRSLHFSPRNHADVALISLANVLHLSKESEAAAILTEAALTISPKLTSLHLMLGNIYAVTGNHNLSIMHYRRMIDLSGPNLDVERRILAVQCNFDLEQTLDDQKRQLSETIEELRAFRVYSDEYEKARSNMLSEAADNPTQLKHKFYYDAQIELERKNALEQSCRIMDVKGKQYLKCRHDQPTKMSPEYLSNMQSLIEREEKNPEYVPFQQKASQIGRIQYMQSIDYSQPLRPPLYYRLEKAIAKDDPINNASWPSLMDCLNISLPTQGQYPSVNLPIENKGFEVKALLGEAQGIGWDEEHDLPWHPPQCMTFSDPENSQRSYDHLEGMKARYTITRPVHLMEKFSDATVTAHLRRYGNRGEAQLEDIGQRILTAMKQKLGPNWLLYHVASLYWRAQGHLFHGLECQRRALYFAPDKHRDVLLVNLASMLYKFGRFKDALTVMKDALAVNTIEPESHYFYANLLAGSGNLTGAIHHYKMSLRQNRKLSEAERFLMTAKCSLRLSSEMCPNQGVCPQKNKSKKIKSAVFNKKIRQDLLKIFRNYNLCNSEAECRLQFQGKGGALPHIKLVLTGPGPKTADRQDEGPGGKGGLQQGVIHGFLWVDQRTLRLEDDECVVFNDTSKSVGCYGDDRLFNSSETVIGLLLDCLKLVHPEQYGSRTSSPSFGAALTTSQRDGTERIRKRLFIEWPTFKECQRIPKIDFTRLISTQLSIEAKGIDTKKILSQLEPDPQAPTQLPMCPHPLGTYLAQIYDKYKVWEIDPPYAAEFSLRDLFETSLGDGTLTAEDIAYKLGVGLKRNQSDWVLAALSGFYYRVRGDTVWSLHCFISAHLHAPENCRDVALIGVANVLARMGFIDAALETTLRALDISPGTVVVHFTLANLYALKGDWHRATLFYESTLGLQSTFKHAADRLRAIQCRDVLANPDKYKEP